MRIYRLLHQMIQRFSEMDESEANELNGEAQNDYNQLLQSAREKKNLIDKVTARNDAGSGIEGFVPDAVPKLTKREALVLKAETWEARYIFAGAFVVLVPMVKRYWNGEDGADNEPQSEFAKFAKAYEMYSNFKKS